MQLKNMLLHLNFLSTNTIIVQTAAETRASGSEHKLTLKATTPRIRKAGGTSRK